MQHVSSISTLHWFVTYTRFLLLIGYRWGTMEIHALLFLETKWQSTKRWGSRWDSGRHNSPSVWAGRIPEQGRRSPNWRRQETVGPCVVVGWLVVGLRTSSCNTTTNYLLVFRWLHRSLLGFWVCGCKKARVRGRGTHLAGGMESGLITTWQPAGSGAWDSGGQGLLLVLVGALWLESLEVVFV